MINKIARSAVYYQTDLSSVPELNGYTPSTGDDIQAGDWVVFSFYRRGTGILIHHLVRLRDGGNRKIICNLWDGIDSYSQTGVSTLIGFLEQQYFK